MRSVKELSAYIINHRIFKAASVIFLLLTIIPFLIVSFYTNPTWDDFDFTVNSMQLGFFRSQYAWYIGWSGRFFSTAVMSSLNPLLLHSVLGYKVASFLMLILFFVSVYLIIRTFTGRSVKTAAVFITALAFCSLYLYKMANVALGFYWLSSAVIYQLADILFLFLLILLMRNYSPVFKGNKTLFIVLISSVILAVQGSNEISMLIAVEFLFFTFIYYFAANKKINRTLLFFLIVSMIGAYMVYSAPGNAVRESKNPVSHMLINSLYISLSDTVRIIIHLLFTTPLLLFTILFIPACFGLLGKKTANRKYFECNPLFTIPAFIVIIYSVNFITYWTLNMGQLDRTLNVFYFFFLLGWFYNILVVCSYLYNKGYIRTFRIPAVAVLIISLLIAYSYRKNNNIFLAYKELFNGSLKNFNSELQDRYDFIRNDKSDTCIVMPLSAPVPGLMFYHDIGPDPGAKHNKYQAYYYKKKYLIVKDN